MPDPKRNLKLPDCVTLLDGRGELPMLRVKTPWSVAEIYLHGAQVTHFQKHGEPPLLFLSQCSQFAEGQAIRGGIPIVFPWFGARAGKSTTHGFARNKDWELKEIKPDKDGSVNLRFRLPDCAEAAGFPKFTVDYLVTVGETLALELIVTNGSQTENFEFENCLHTYFFVSDILAVSIRGLRGASYLDKNENFARTTETADAIRVNSEVDRTYLDTTATVEIHDARLARKIWVEKAGSASTVVWNPWIERAAQLSDLGDDEYLQMVCVESGNVATDQIILPPQKSSVLKVRLKSERLT